MIKIAILLFSLCVVYGLDLEEGEQCNHNGAVGTCINFRNCPSAQEGLKKKIYPLGCGYSGFESRVCCISSGGGGGGTTQSAPVATTPRVRWTTHRYRPTVPDYRDVNGGEPKTCVPIPPEQTSKRTGQKAWDKCLEYQERFLYPCKKSVTLVAGVMEREDNCMHDAEELVVGGENATLGEFPHMVLLGFGTEVSKLSWECGATLLSEKFIMTAGHCTINRELVKVSYALIGILHRTSEVDISKLYKILRIIKHPGYNSPFKYNDIALLETEDMMKLTPFTVPACLHIGDLVKDDKALATGWGHTQYKGRTGATTLQKVIVQKFDQKECASRNPPHKRYLPRGYDGTTQMCYGDKTNPKDTCQGDSGGPLQIKSKEIYCMYTIIGVTSYGNGCGFAEDPGVYTKVAPYVPWIESVLWPDN